MLGGHNDLTADQLTAFANALRPATATEWDWWEPSGCERSDTWCELPHERSVGRHLDGDL